MSDGKEVKRWGIWRRFKEDSLMVVHGEYDMSQLGPCDTAIEVMPVADHDRIVARQAKEIGRLHEKWVYYENEHILPCFKWARDMGFVLDVTKNNPENLNSTELFFNLMKTKITQLRAELETTIAELRAEVEDLKSVQEALIETAKKNQEYYEFESSRLSKLVASQEEAIENIRQQVRAMHFDIELAATERAEGEKE